MFIASVTSHSSGSEAQRASKGKAVREDWINQRGVREGKREGRSVNEVRREGGMRGGRDESCSLSPCINPLQ